MFKNVKVGYQLHILADCFVNGCERWQGREEMFTYYWHPSLTWLFYERKERRTGHMSVTGILFTFSINRFYFSTKGSICSLRTLISPVKCVHMHVAPLVVPPLFSFYLVIFIFLFNMLHSSWEWESRVGCEIWFHARLDCYLKSFILVKLVHTLSTVSE